MGQTLFCLCVLLIYYILNPVPGGEDIIPISQMRKQAQRGEVLQVPQHLSSMVQTDSQGTPLSQHMLASPQGCSKEGARDSALFARALFNTSLRSSLQAGWASGQEVGKLLEVQKLVISGRLQLGVR